KSGVIDLSGTRKISPSDFLEWTAKARPTAHDVVLSRRCNPGVTAYVPPGVEFALGQNLVLLRAKGERVYPPFLRWLVQGPVWWSQIEKYLNVGAVFDSLRCADVPMFEVVVPPLDEQRRIAAVLGALDDKIELNRKMNQTLEEMAQAVFKSWFIDFDGVPPEDLVDSEHGPIPKGWEVQPLLTIAELLSGGTPKTSRTDFWDGDIKWASAKDVSQCSDRFLVETERKITETGLTGSATRLIPKGAVIIVARGATCGRWRVLGETMAMNQTCYALVSRRADLESFVRHLVPTILGRLVLQAHGSVFDTITTKTFAGSTIVVPPEGLRRRFAAVIEPIDARLLNNVQESQTLAELRDTLLPRLISGELRIPG
ncbi:MAG: restriction endonuclease subunit S, partial [Polyangiaceae bacterium]|nr:restriction endonuclease subunit S [Polyangiaceae bacterium]